MSKLETLSDGLLEGLKDLYSAENQLLKALPKLEKKASNKKLKTLFNMHLKETEGQMGRLKSIESIMQVKLSGKTCKAMQGLIEEGKEVLEKQSKNDALIDALLIGAATRVEHYEIAAYKSALTMAEELGEGEVAYLLEETLAEETAANEKLCNLSEEEVLTDANISDESVSKLTKENSRVSGSTRNGSRGAGAAKLVVAAGLLTSFMANYSVALAEPGAETVSNERNAVTHAPDNTGRNTRDLNEERSTADDQSLMISPWHKAKIGRY